MQRTFFDDFEAYESAAEGWGVELRKLDAQPVRGLLIQLAVGPVRVAYTRLDSTLELSGAAPPGLRSFGLPTQAAGDALWCREPTSLQTVSVYDASGSFEASTPPGFETLVFSATPEHLADLGDSLGIGTPDDGLAIAGVTACQPGPMRALRQSLLQIVSALARDASLAEQPALRCALEQDVPARLLEALGGSRPQPRPVAPHLRQRALRRALELVAAHPCQPFSVGDLCRASGASERTLRRAFSEQLGVSPKAYLQARRLNGVYRELRRGARPGLRINEAAHRFGFWHMGQFAADYRRHFGELPSETLARSPYLVA